MTATLSDCESVMKRRGKLSCFSLSLGGRLPMKLDTDPVAGRADPATRAEWRDGFADPLSKGHEETVELFPVSDRHDFSQGELGLGGCFGFDES